MGFTLQYVGFAAFWSTEEMIYTESSLYFHISYLFPFSSNACATYMEWKSVSALRATYNSVHDSYRHTVL